MRSFWFGELFLLLRSKPFSCMCARATFSVHTYSCLRVWMFTGHGLFGFQMSSNVVSSNDETRRCLEHSIKRCFQIVIKRESEPLKCPIPKSGTSFGRPISCYGRPCWRWQPDNQATPRARAVMNNPMWRYCRRANRIECQLVGQNHRFQGTVPCRNTFTRCCANFKLNEVDSLRFGGFREFRGWRWEVGSLVWFGVQYSVRTTP